MTLKPIYFLFDTNRLRPGLKQDMSEIIRKPIMKLKKMEITAKGKKKEVDPGIAPAGKKLNIWHNNHHAVKENRADTPKNPPP